MGAMAAPGITSPARIKLTDLIGIDGLPSENYKHAVGSLAQSLRNFNAAIIQIPESDNVLLRCVLDSVRMFFHSKPMVGADALHSEDPQNWNGAVGYYVDPQHFREIFDFRPGRMNVEGPAMAELTPTGLPELFASLGRATRIILDAIACSLELRSYSFTDLLDNVPLKAGETATSVISSCCHNRPGAHLSANVLNPEQAALSFYEEDADKGLLTLLKSDKPGLQIRDIQGRWFVADADLGPQDMVLFTGLSLYQATGGYLNPSMHRTDNNTNLGQAQGSMSYGRCTVAFKLMPRATAILHCSAMTAAGHLVGGPFQQPIAVHDFMQRNHTIDQLSGRPSVPPFSFAAPLEAQSKATIKRKKQVSRGKPLAPSKRLRLEAQRVLKERVQEIADNKGLKIRYCNLKECEEQHLNSMVSPCAELRAQMGWPAGVPFVHPHDLPNKAKQAFLEAYEPGWTAAQDGDLHLVDASQAQQGHMLALAGAPHAGGEDQRYPPKPTIMEDQRFAVKTVFDYLRAKGKPVPTGKPQVVGHKVDISCLAKASFEAGGRAQFDAEGGFQRFIGDQFQLETASERDKERALERLKKLYDQVLSDYVEDLVASSQQVG
ncbi:uncharacterized protein [Physcomitrium patens]|uniref:Uncharacterized protein n=1 Tax=Physcomitrium patens TaxID=3218 RepID=A0A2K1JY27_PHYPA|nr:uncharacterized protein LOC112287796 isoform X2 [Physcomitrium patens]PNR46434.1 hypothetical protein PHYPA_013553 [Physcomitrium patens]|eukprot:XP_024386979.1 uncharacterized protein LOC112287796 isoform X2 [Physcomitrella patens]